MYNLNGKKMLNCSKSISTNSLVFGGTNTFYDVDGNATSYNCLYYATNSSSYLALYVLGKLCITGYQLTRCPSTPVSSGAMVNAMYDIGYRQGGFTDTTYTRMTNVVNDYASVSMSSGIPTITITNSTSSSMTINEVDIIILLWETASSSANKRAFIIAGFNLGEVTIAPNDSYSFTISNV